MSKFTQYTFYNSHFKVNNSVVLNAFTVCTDCPCCSKAFHPSRRKRLPMKQLLPIPLLFRAWQPPSLCYVSMDLCLLDILYPWNHAVCDLLCLASFTQHNVFEVYPHCSVLMFLSFLWLHNIHCVNLSHFVHPFTCWWALGLFPFPAMNMGIKGPCLHFPWL